MYTYYFFAISGYKALAAPIAPYITSLQLTQMVVGSVVTFFSAKQYYETTCAVDPANFKLGLAMYVSYFVLFAILFYKKFGKKQTDALNKFKAEQKICGVDMKPTDAAGFFHTQAPAKAEKKE
jgi:hypothetical protein